MLPDYAISGLVDLAISQTYLTLLFGYWNFVLSHSGSRILGKQC